MTANYARFMQFPKLIIVRLRAYEPRITDLNIKSPDDNTTNGDLDDISPVQLKRLLKTVLFV